MLNQVRVIGGKWRGRKIFFPDLASLRPTPNRIRETLFNWLMPYIRDAVCLDMFAGSGSLSFEALSRGAAHIVLWEHSKEALQALQENARRFKTTNFEIHSAHFPNFLPKGVSHQFDVIFLDPPFHQGYIKEICAWLTHSNYLKKNTLIYIETESSLKLLPIPKNWEILKAKKAGEVMYYLVRGHSSHADVGG